MQRQCEDRLPHGLDPFRAIQFDQWIGIQNQVLGERDFFHSVFFDERDKMLFASQ